jgi:hypothetical protein
MNAKKIINLNFDLNTSAKDPKYYGERFKVLVKRIFNTDNLSKINIW